LRFLYIWRLVFIYIYNKLYNKLYIIKYYYPNPNVFSNEYVICKKLSLSLW
jgi:hypothetical protein